eukprot:gene32048-40508_t
MGYYLSPQARSMLPKYKYRGSDLSLIYRYVLTPMNDILIKYIPLWMAPNLVTLLGVAVAVSAHLITQFHSPLLVGELPLWVYLYDTAATFVYQTLDNLDGKQARRTGSSSPLGLLFDHGCDAINVTIGCFCQAAVMQTGCSLDLLFLWLLTAIPFYFNSLEQLHTDSFILPIINGPTEGLLVLCATKLATAYFGAEFWLQPSSLVPSLPNNSLLIYIAIAGAVLTTMGNLFTIFCSPTRRQSMLTVLLQLFPFAALQ